MFAILRFVQEEGN